MRDWLQRRVLYGQYEKLVAELREEDVRGYKNYIRISPELFQRTARTFGYQTGKRRYLYGESPAAWASS